MSQEYPKSFFVEEEFEDLPQTDEEKKKSLEEKAKNQKLQNNELLELAILQSKERATKKGFSYEDIAENFFVNKELYGQPECDDFLESFIRNNVGTPDGINEERLRKKLQLTFNEFKRYRTLDVEILEKERQKIAADLEAIKAKYDNKITAIEGPNGIIHIYDHTVQFSVESEKKQSNIQENLDLYKENNKAVTRALDYIKEKPKGVSKVLKVHQYRTMFDESRKQIEENKENLLKEEPDFYEQKGFLYDVVTALETLHLGFIGDAVTSIAQSMGFFTSGGSKVVKIGEDIADVLPVTTPNLRQSKI